MTLQEDLGERPGSRALLVTPSRGDLWEGVQGAVPQGSWVLEGLASTLPWAKSRQELLHLVPGRRAWALGSSLGPTVGWALPTALSPPLALKVGVSGVNCLFHR